VRQQGPGLSEHLQRQLVPRPVADRLRDTAPLAARPVLGPLLGQVEPDIDQGMLAVRGVAHEDPDLAVVALAEPPEPVALHPDRGGPLLGESRGVEDDHPVGGAQRAAHLARQLAQQGLMLPGGGADEMLEAVTVLVVTVGDRLGVLALEVGDEPGEVGLSVVSLFLA
jgi:hypothetical protein